MIAWALFINPMQVSTTWALWMVLPLCLGVAAAYKAVRVPELQGLWLEIAKLMVLMVGGLAVLGAGLWAVHRFMP
jgi:hypothetical protein